MQRRLKIHPWELHFPRRDKIVTDGDDGTIIERRLEMVKLTRRATEEHKVGITKGYI